MMYIYANEYWLVECRFLFVRDQNCKKLSEVLEAPNLFLFFTKVTSMKTKRVMTIMKLIPVFSAMKKVKITR